MHWSDAVRELRLAGQPGVLATVVDVRGHAPRGAGAKMVIGPERSWGTVGGGNLEAETLLRAADLLASGADTDQFTDRLNAHVSARHGRQCCGGEVTVLLERLPAPATVAIVGLGHVGYELARILARHDVRLELIDSRAEQLDPLRLADLESGPAVINVHRAVVPELIMENLPVGSQLLIMTHDHAEDFALCDAALRLGGRLGFVGLIGSSAKWTRFRRLLAEAGHDDEALTRIHCPVGQPGIDGKEPALIALAVAADLAGRGVLSGYADTPRVRA